MLLLLTGDPAMLHQLVSKGGVDMSTIDKMSPENLVDVCKTCGIVYSGKSKVCGLYLSYFVVS